MLQLTVAGDGDAAARTTAERIAAAIATARAARGVAHLALAGGRTPGRTYQQLAHTVDDWSGVHCWLGDERCVPLDDGESNYYLVATTLLAGVGEVRPTLHPVHGAADDPEAAAAAYERELQATVPGAPPQLDLALLGLGEDGHTASLFPNDVALDEEERLCLAVRGTKAPFDRVTMTLPLLRAARQIVILAEGAGKAWAITQMMGGPTPHVPATLLTDGPETEIELIVDAAAAPA